MKNEVDANEIIFSLICIKSTFSWYIAELHTYDFPRSLVAVTILYETTYYRASIVYCDIGY